VHPNDLFEVDTMPVERPAWPASQATPASPASEAARGRSMPPL
jgi:putative transcriptional regulator